MDDRRVMLRADSSAQSSVDAYVEYRRIVGDDDILMTPAEFEVCACLAAEVTV
jgi:hypothetical protein